MNSIFCFVSLFSVSFAFNVLIYTVSDYNKSYAVDSVPVLVQTSYEFDYYLNDDLAMDIRLKNKAPHLSAVVFVKLQTGADLTNITISKWSKSKKFLDCLRVRGKLNYQTIVISLQLNTASGSCATHIISKGVATKSTNRKGNGTCIFPSTCITEIDLLDECKDSSVVTRTSETPKIQETTARPVTDSENLNVNTYISNVSTSPHDNIETTTNKMTASGTNAETTNYTVIITSSLFGIALILLVIVAIWKRCWIKHNPLGTSPLPTNAKLEPFYLNLLFRKECDRELEEIDQHYTEIDQRFYEDINSREIPNKRVTEGSLNVQ